MIGMYIVNSLIDTMSRFAELADGGYLRPGFCDLDLCPRPTRMPDNRHFLLRDYTYLHVGHTLRRAYNLPVSYEQVVGPADMHSHNGLNRSYETDS